MARQAIRAPEQQPPRYGLLAAAPAANDPPGFNWHAGWEFSRMPCAPGGITPVNCEGGNDARDPDDQGASDLVVGDPLLVWAARRCTLRGFPVGEYEARARQMLASTVSYWTAREFWTGEQRDALGDPTMQDNAALVDIGSDTVTAGPVEAHAALSLLVGAIGPCIHGGRGMIHVTPQLLQQLVFEGSVYRDGNLWLAAMGHIVVADDGYDGSGPGATPAGASQWAYATTMVSIRQSEVNVPGSVGVSDGQVPSAEELGRGGWLDRATNTVTVYADQMVGFQRDGCCTIAAEVNLPVPLVGGVS